MRAIVLSVGDELVLGQTVDTNSAYLASELARHGIRAIQHLTIADDQAVLTEAIGHAARHADLLLITGGLGPTADDLTRQALADAMGVDLVEDLEALIALEAFFRARGRPMPDSNRVQITHPRGSTLIDNTCGTAPGIRAQLHDADLFIMPGVPREMRDMFQRSVLPHLATGTQTPILTATLHSFGQGESTIGEKLGPLMARDRNPTVGTTVAQGICSVRVRGDDTAALEATLDAVRERLGPIVYGCDPQTLPGVVVDLLKQQQLTVATAESCTGGLIGKMLTDVPGSSAVYVGGWVTYSNTMKQSQLGVDEKMLQANGAVSGPVVAAMARGAVERSGATIGLSVSGVAGPEGGMADKPVGTVWISLYHAGQTPTELTVRAMVPGDRQTVRDRAAKTVLQMLRLHLIGEPIETISWITPLTQATR